MINKEAYREMLTKVMPAHIADRTIDAANLKQFGWKKPEEEVIKPVMNLEPVGPASLDAAGKMAKELGESGIKPEIGIRENQVVIFQLKPSNP